jgi:hypothetical protein
MPEEFKNLDALIVDIEDSTTLLKLYVGRLTKAPARTTFYPPLVEHSSEVAAAVARLGEHVESQSVLLRVARVLTSVSAELNAAGTATLRRILVLQEAIDLLEGQLDHMLQGGAGVAPEVTAGLPRLEASADSARLGSAREALREDDAARAAHDAQLEHNFEEDPFDEFALSDEFLDELVDGFDAAFDANTAPLPALAPVPSASHFEPASVEPGPVALSDAEAEALKELFAQIAQSYVSPIVEFIGKLRVGPVSGSWVDLCMPAVDAMLRASSSMGYAALGDALTRFAGALQEAQRTGRVIDGDERARVLAEYQKLAEILPTAFPLVESDATTESESIILNSLLKQIKGVGRVTIGRLFSAGLVSLEAFYLAEPSDLAAATGIKLALSERICDRFRIYQTASELAEDQGHVVRRLEQLVEELRAAQFEFKKATLDEWYTHKPSREKAKARRSRQQTMWKINVSLAELGELATLKALKEEVYDKRLERLEAVLDRRRSAGAPPSGALLGIEREG